MTTRFGLRTRSYDLTMEGETVDDIVKLLDLAESSGLFMQRTKAPTGLVQDRTAISINADFESKYQTESEGGERLLGEPASAVDAFGREDDAFRLIVKSDGDTLVLSPKFPPNADGSDRADSAAMVLLGAYDAKNRVPITGSLLLKSLRRTGYAVDRADRQMEPLEQKGLVLPEGVRRGRKYRLSESGRAEARRLAQELASVTGQVSGGATHE